MTMWHVGCFVQRLPDVTKQERSTRLSQPRRWTATRELAALIIVGGATLMATPLAQHTALESAAEMLGADSIRTIWFTASGATFTVGQNFTPDEPWPRVALTRYTVVIDYERLRMRQEFVREMGRTMPRGGGVPFTGELRQ